MASPAATILIHDDSLSEELRIPAEAQSFGGFRRWAHSEEFPERGRIDYLAGEIEPRARPEVFAPVPGGWGRRGATYVTLQSADEATVYDALLMAWRNTAPKGLLKLHPSLSSPPDL
jgi:hypothetical protein